MTMRNLIAGISALAIGSLMAFDSYAEDAPKDYTIIDGKVDQGTYNGYRRYGESCLRCHGPDAGGSSYAPDLTDSLKHMTKDEVLGTIINGRKNVTSSQDNVMPAFGEVEDVALYLDDIYGYLKARSDGKLGRGRPERFPVAKPAN